jgi:hypothetical protein
VIVTTPRFATARTDELEPVVVEVDEEPAHAAAPSESAATNPISAIR